MIDKIYLQILDDSVKASYIANNGNNDNNPENSS